jgi:hypothetical protein
MKLPAGFTRANGRFALVRRLALSGEISRWLVIWASIRVLRARCAQLGALRTTAASSSSGLRDAFISMSSFRQEIA